MTRVIEVLVAGFGQVARNSYLPACQALGLPLHGVVETDEIRRGQAAAHAESFSSVPAAPTRPGSTPLALNLTPAPVHEQMTRRLLSSGWHVYSEKPAASSAEAWSELVTTARRQSRALLSAPLLPWGGRMPELRQAIAGSADVNVAIDLVREGPAGSGVIEPDRQWFFAPGYGPLWDLGTYGAAVLASFFGVPTDLRAQVRSRDVTLRVGTAGGEVGVSIPTYEVELTWGELTRATMRIGFDREPEDPYNIVVRTGGRTLSASLWDYFLPVRHSGVVPEQWSTVESRKYVHALTEVARLLGDERALRGHQDEVGITLGILQRIETTASLVTVT